MANAEQEEALQKSTVLEALSNEVQQLLAKNMSAEEYFLRMPTWVMRPNASATRYVSTALHASGQSYTILLSLARVSLQ